MAICAVEQARASKETLERLIRKSFFFIRSLSTDRMSFLVEPFGLGDLRPVNPRLSKEGFAEFTALANWSKQTIA